MPKSNEELNALKKEVESVSEKIRELTPEELEQVTGGAGVKPIITAGIGFVVAGIKSSPEAIKKR